MNTTDTSSCSCNRGKAERGPASGDRPQLPKAHSKRLNILFLALASMILFLGALPAQASAQTIVTDKADYAPGEIVTVTGTGWLAGETVLLVFHSEPNTYGDITYFTFADENGNFTNSSFAPDISDIGATITVTATGQTSGLTAQTTFTDSNLKDKCPGGTYPNPEACGNGGYACAVGCYSGSHCTGVYAYAEDASDGGTIGTMCRELAGDCDVAEMCDGTSADCPVDAFAPSTTMCRESAGDCDIAEMCDGGSAVCPADEFVTAGTECRAGTGECDVAESCTGSDADCPEDTFQPEGTVCGDDSNSICDNPDTCDGLGSCQANNEPTTTLCRADAGECDVAEYCDGAGYCPDDGFEEPGTPCGDQTAGLCTGPGMCNDEGTCLSGNHPCGMVTSSSLCPFDMEPTKGACAEITGYMADQPIYQYTNQACLCSSGTYDDGVCVVGDSSLSCGSGGICKLSNDFRLLFSPDVQQFPSYKLNASNPGQFYYNLIVDTETVTITIPYPFVTQGARPVHVYGGDVPIVNDCFLPEEGSEFWSGGPVITMEDWVDGTSAEEPYNFICKPSDGPDIQPVASCSFTINVPAEAFSANGLAYVNIHLDYGLKGINVNANPPDGNADRYNHDASLSNWNSSNALLDDSSEIGIQDLQNYWFSHLAESAKFGDFIQNVNLFKGIAGAFGQVSYSVEDLVEGLPGYYLELVDSENNVVQTGLTDEDGYYLLQYKHKGKPAPYTIDLYESEGGPLIYTTSPSFYLQGNGWVEINFNEEELEFWGHTAEYGSGKYAK